MLKKVVKWLGWISIVLAFIYGQFYRNDNKGIQNLEIVKNNELKRIGHSNIYKAYESDTIIAFLATGKANGYGGPLEVAVLADSSGNIMNIELVSYNETYSYIKKLKSKNYFRQYQDKALNSKFQIKDDIEAVSGATISSNAIALAAKEAAYNIAENQLNIEVPKIEKKWHITPKEGIVLLVFILGILATYKRNKKLRYLSLALSFIFLGFLFNSSLSVAHFGRLMLGYLPGLHEHLIWWILMGGTLVSIIFWGKNVYCHAICPFHATQVLLNKLSGINLKVGPKTIKIIKNTPLFLLWLSLVLILISTNPTISSYEPFALLFSLDGVGIQWYILPAALIGALFISDMFCKFFCPVGAAFKWIHKQRKFIKSKFNKNEKIKSELTEVVQSKKLLEAKIKREKLNLKQAGSILLYSILLIAIILFLADNFTL